MTIQELTFAYLDKAFNKALIQFPRRDYLKVLDYLENSVLDPNSTDIFNVFLIWLQDNSELWPNVDSLISDFRKVFLYDSFVNCHKSFAEPFVLCEAEFCYFF